MFSKKLKNKVALYQGKIRKLNDDIDCFIDQIDKFRAENHRLRKELQKEKEVNKDLQGSIVSLCTTYTDSHDHIDLCIQNILMKIVDRKETDLDKD